MVFLSRSTIARWRRPSSIGRSPFSASARIQRAIDATSPSFPAGSCCKSCCARARCESAEEGSLANLFHLIQWREYANSGPKDFFALTIVLVRAILEQDYDLHLSPIPALQDLRTWQSFRENFIENPSSAISFFDVFMGQKPNWDFPEHFLSRPAVRRSEALMLWPSVFPPD